PRLPICVGRSSCKANASSLPKVLLRPRRTFKGYMSAVESKRREDLLLEQKQNIANLRRQLTDNQNKLAEAQSSLKQLPTATSRKIQPLRDQISEVQQRAAESKGRSSYVVRAPADGRISMSQVSMGQTVQPQRLQMEIVPDGTPL